MALNNYIEDDWDDNALSGRTSAEKDVFYQYSTGGTGDLLKGVYRPRWKGVKGSPSASSGAAQLSAGDSIATRSRFNTGYWEHTYQADSTPGGGNMRLWVMADDMSVDNNLVRLIIANGGNFDLRKYVGGSQSNIVSGGVSNPGKNQHTDSISRDSYGRWEIFHNGSSQGTSTDTYIPEPLSYCGSEDAWDVAANILSFLVT